MMNLNGVQCYVMYVRKGVQHSLSDTLYFCKQEETQPLIIGRNQFKENYRC